MIIVLIFPLLFYMSQLLSFRLKKKVHIRDEIVGQYHQLLSVLSFLSYTY